MAIKVVRGKALMAWPFVKELFFATQFSSVDIFLRKNTGKIYICGLFRLMYVCILIAPDKSQICYFVCRAGKFCYFKHWLRHPWTQPSAQWVLSNRTDIQTFIISVILQDIRLEGYPVFS